VPDHSATALIATRRERVDRALKAVEDVGLTLQPYFEALVVVVPADFTFSHDVPFVVRPDSTGDAA
jgi:hypothetical protein